MLPALTRSLAAALWAAHGLRSALTLARPRPSDLKTRLAAIPSRDAPLAARVVIHWNEHQVPFIDAESDDDLATALGVVHAHLRLAQLELLRRASRGRLAELFGPIAFELDHALRILDFARAVPAIVPLLPEDTRRWLERFVAGINHYLAQATALPPEFAILGMAREPWRIEDVLTLGRLAASDVSWLVWFRLLALRRSPDWPDAWLRHTGGVESPATAARASAGVAALERLLLAASRSGSNALALAPARTMSGAALLAADPHLSLMQPNLWLIAGMRSPSYQASGLMIPGLPLIAIGRNPHLAWAGTNLHAASSELVDVSSLAPGAFSERRERIAVRWGKSREVVIRESPFGPVVSDAPQLGWSGPETLALRWIGHRASDETSAMLRACRAREVGEFIASLEGFAVPGLTVLAADRAGRIGRITAAHLPARGPELPREPFAQPQALQAWERILTSRELPLRLAPEEGYLVSANERPESADALLGFFFSPDDRHRRIAELIESGGQLSAEKVMALQRDVQHRPALELLERLRPPLLELAASRRANAGARRLLAALAAWDGEYDADSAGALAFELLLYRLARELIAPSRRRAHEAGWLTRPLLARDIADTSEAALVAALRKALPSAGRRFVRHARWGALHRLRLAHPLARTPWLGKRFRYGDFPASGSSETVMKTAHPLTDKRHAASYGSNARFVADLASAERAFIVLLGGQDGWPGSSTALDQVGLWRRGGFIAVPMTPESARGRARGTTVLEP
ncbi:MAG TPA: penicillin acylase family protein [Alphaproteobacteria bacterium]|nr:penicillin acylase family protein [Alphaproteobacteria bacterium]